MNDAQLQQLIGVIRAGGGGGHKTSKFSSAEGTEWQIWQRNLEQTLQINGWANERCQREAAAAMESTAAEFTFDIPGFVAGRNIQDMLNLYETRFLPAAAGQLTAAQFQTAAQMDGELIAVWHARLRTIFERTFPGENIQNSRLLINKFVLKLADSNIRQWTHRANLATYNAAMTAASNEAASQSILAHEAGSGGKSNVAINAFGGGGACHGCGSYNHHIAKCTKHRPAKRSRTIRQWERLAKRDERATTQETRNGARGSPTSIHQQDPDSKDGSLLGNHGGAETEDLSTTWRM
jgi:hypothetical protein